MNSLLVWRSDTAQRPEVPLPAIQLLIGQKRQSLAFNTYSFGQRLDLRKAIDKLRYSDEVMRLLSTNSGSSNPKRK
jgi:hypothetical protein